MTSTKRKEVTKIWAILQIAGDIFFLGGGGGGWGEWGGGRLFFFHHMQSSFLQSNPLKTQDF